jgi:hypothetical protein
MNDFESERAAKAARFRQLAEKHANIATGRHFATRQRLEMIPLGQPILLGTIRRNGIAKTSPASMSISPRRRNITIRLSTSAAERPTPNPTWSFLTMTPMQLKSWSIKLSVSKSAKA